MLRDPFSGPVELKAHKPDIPVLSAELKAEMPRRRSLFWDVDPMRVDPEENARYVIERILDYGSAEEVRWMWRTYPRVTIRQVLDLPRCVVHPKSRALWELLLA